ncbi:carbamoyl-phosphate synthase arginine-specific small chain [Halobacillus andaensis]|uniref:Carbamoyl phosphate synthase small chain n=1 Tax=Halobacillus andaensis TaxID=1176239 RepID=A0A917B369_HALAA|nr:carbamoyl phosphate synthase small subunit [Halobacillus andaensis]MBP2004629.1 carbamoyl-phosphate synthase small subunit [Halobacillus andaensis]GGF20184.1 carbamoyl-phosphate synthase arginine-specific small chain [Halobacillus andaensis]
MQGFLTLQEGQSFQGEASGHWETPVEGEVVFFTGMTGYQEVLTDPSYKGQIVVFTYPLIGNYGINEDDFESEKPQVSGVVMMQCAEAVYHYQATTSLKDYLNKWNVPFLTEVDTREVTKSIRSEGTCQAVMDHQSLKPSDTKTVGQIFQASKQEVAAYGEGSQHIVVIDFGYKGSIVDQLVEKGVRVSVVPFTNVHKVHELNPDGVVLSNGPGDPKDATKFLSEIKGVLEQYPSLGICFGHQVIALAYGADTKKLAFGHRGANHPVKDVQTGRVFITSQNHNYVVDDASIENTVLEVSFSHVNDGSVEGLMHPSKPILSAQFHPEANPGPEDALWLFDEFFTSVNKKKGVQMYA